MPNLSIVVEGAHDASFLGQLLINCGFTSVLRLDDIPEAWKALIPKTYPVDGSTLTRVIRYPEVYVRGITTIGIMTAGSDSQLISTLRIVLDAIGPANLAAVAIYIDVDHHNPLVRFRFIRRKLSLLNKAARKEGEPGYPVAVPNAAGVVMKGAPSVGVFLFPNNVLSGALEDVLLECAKVNHPEIANAAISLVDHLDRQCPNDQADLKALRSGMGKGKAKVGTIANLLKPGVSVAVSLSRTKWLTGGALQHDHVVRAREFLEAIIECA